MATTLVGSWGHGPCQAKCAGRQATECQLQAGFKIPFDSLFSFLGISIVSFLFSLFFQPRSRCALPLMPHTQGLALPPHPWHSLTQAQEGQRHHRPTQGPTNIRPVPAAMLPGSTDTGHTAGAPQTTHTAAPASGVFPLDMVPIQVGCGIFIGEAEGRRGARAEPVRGRERRKILWHYLVHSLASQKWHCLCNTDDVR